MKRWTRILLLTAATASLGLTGVAAASGSTVVASAPNAANQLVASQAQALTSAPDVIVQTEYVPIVPCRIADTRISTGKLLVNVTKTFVVSGSSDLSAQGGNINGCPIPLGASAIAASVTSPQADGSGFLRAWATGTPEPQATILNYRGQGISVGDSLPIRTTAGTQLAVKAFAHRTDLVIDVLGYYREPIAAGISSNGTLGSHSNHVVSSARGGGNPTGVYVVTFDQTVAGCILQATPATTGYVLVTGVLNGTSATLVGRAPGTGTLADTPIAITVTC